MELVVERACGGKVARRFHGQPPVMRQRIVHKSAEPLVEALGGVRRLAVQGAVRSAFVVEADVCGQLGFLPL